MINLALIPLEKAINHALKTDPKTQAQLNTLCDKIIKLDITDWNLKLFVLPHTNHIELQTQCSETPNTIIRGKLNDLVHIGLAKDKQAAMQTHRITFEGDADVGMTLQRVLTQLNIDWERYLSDIVGDQPGQLISQTLKKVASFGNQVLNSLKNSTKDYIFYEKRLFPTKTELETFYHDVATLRDDVDRLAARVQHLQQRRQS